jgi:hypothetical protein
MNKTELIMRRRNVLAFIQADPIKLVISRSPEPTKNTETGGWVKSAPTDLNPQTARIVLNKRRYTNGLINSEAGDIPHTDYLLIAMYNKNIEVEDTFVWLGDNYHVTGIYGARTESILASIDMLGPVNHDG